MMKKTIFMIFWAALVVLSSCKKDEIGGTATEAMAGEWYVTVLQEYTDPEGNPVLEDMLEVGSFILTTSNTAANVPTEMFVNDCGGFWDFQVKVTADPQTMTFATDGMASNYAYECNVGIEDGKIMLGAATTPSGMPADSIAFYVTFDDDDYQIAGYYERHLITGYRYTGFTADE